MPDFETRSGTEIIHVGDGWYYTVEEYDDNLIRIRYSEPDSLGGHKESFEGLWPESARKVAAALIRVADEIESPSAVKEVNSPEFTKGFYAGLAYASYGQEMFEAAKSVSSS